MSVRTDYTRDELLIICDRAIVPQRWWRDRDSASAVRQVGECMVLLLAGCEFLVRTEPNYPSDRCVTSDRTIWIDITYHGFSWFEEGEPQAETFYLPTPDRLKAAAGGDWY